MKRLAYILLLMITMVVIAGSDLFAQRFRLEEGDNSQIEVKFDAARQNDQIVFSWSVNVENNIRSYEIIRGKENGRYLDWEVMNRVNVDGSADKNYSYTDNSPILGEMHYRLRLVAPDGSSVDYSPLFKIQTNTVQSSTKK